MKTRNGFVSNSSSSSFVVAFPKKPESVQDVLKYMFDGKEGGLSLEYYEDGLSYNQICQRVYDDLIKSENGENGKTGPDNQSISTLYLIHLEVKELYL